MFVKRLKSGVIVVSISLENEQPVCLEDKIMALLMEFTADVIVWADIRELYKPDVFCGLFMDSINQGLELSPEVLKALSERHLKLGLDIYTPVEAWPDDHRE